MFGAERALVRERMDTTHNGAYLSTMETERMDRRELQEFRSYYNGSRVHQSLNGSTPEEMADKPRPGYATLGSFGWREHCRGLFQTPMAA
ncbi:MAG: hypothetical protein ACMG6H_11320 [Acidobacteriota bacterium]